MRYTKLNRDTGKYEDYGYIGEAPVDDNYTVYCEFCDAEIGGTETEIADPCPFCGAFMSERPI